VTIRINPFSLVGVFGALAFTSWVFVLETALLTPSTETYASIQLALWVSAILARYLWRSSATRAAAVIILGVIILEWVAIAHPTPSIRGAPLILLLGFATGTLLTTLGLYHFVEEWFQALRRRALLEATTR
jgi:hypothetical protein